jgi:hypothetical protein
LRHYDVRGKDILWVPLFAANDRGESVVQTFEVLKVHYNEDATGDRILNKPLGQGAPGRSCSGGWSRRIWRATCTT